MRKNAELKPEYIIEPLRERLNRPLAEPVPDQWLEPLVRQLYGHLEDEEEAEESQVVQAGSPTDDDLDI